MQSSMAYLDLEPNDEELQEEAEDQGFHMIEAIGERTSQATETLADKDVVVIGDGDTIEHQEPEAGTRLLEDETVILITNGDEKTIPDMSGWSRRDVLKMVHLLDLELDYSGSGYVVQQEPIAGTAIAEGDAVSVTLESTPPQEVDETEEETEASEEDASDE